MRRTFKDGPPGGKEAHGKKNKPADQAATNVIVAGTVGGLGASLGVGLPSTASISSVSSLTFGEDYFNSPDIIVKSASESGFEGGKKGKDCTKKKNRKKKKYPGELKGNFTQGPAGLGDTSLPGDFWGGGMFPLVWGEGSAYPVPDVTSIEVHSAGGCDSCSKKPKKPDHQKSCGEGGPPNSDKTPCAKKPKVVQEKKPCKNITTKALPPPPPPTRPAKSCGPCNTTQTANDLPPANEIPPPDESKGNGQPPLTPTNSSTGPPKVTSGQSSEVPKKNCTKDQFPKLAHPSQPPKNSTELPPIQPEEKSDKPPVKPKHDHEKPPVETKGSNDNPPVKPKDTPSPPTEPTGPTKDTIPPLPTPSKPTGPTKDTIPPLPTPSEPKGEPSIGSKHVDFSSSKKTGLALLFVWSVCLGIDHFYMKIMLTV